MCQPKTAVHCFLFQGLVVQWVSRLPGEDGQKGGLPGTLQRASTHLGQNGTVMFPMMIARTLHLLSYFYRRYIVVAVNLQSTYCVCVLEV